MALFNSKYIREVSEDVKKLVAQAGHGSKLLPRDPAMYGDHHKCNACGEPAKYIKKDTHWCKYCWSTDEYPHLTGLTQEERDKLQAENLAKVTGPRLVNPGDGGVRRDDAPGAPSFSGIGFGR